MSARFADKLHVGSCEGKDHFLLIISAALKLSAKNGQAKIASRNFFGALFAPIFSRPQKWAEKRSEFFWTTMGQKRGATQALRRSVLPLYATQWCQRCKNVTLCQRVTELLLNLDCRLLFLSLFSIDNSDAE